METLTETVNGFLWPKRDRTGRLASFCVDELEIACGFVRDWSACIQAGGFCGVWPKHLAAKFGTVFTFEPDPLNFQCLTKNVDGLSVLAWPACLGDQVRSVRMVRDHQNAGAGYVDLAPGDVAMMTIDTLELERCGLIYLDIEGCEPLAIRGGIETIARCKPVIAVENKHSERYGVNSDRLEEIICTLGYQVVARPRRDVVFVHESHLR